MIIHNLGINFAGGGGGSAAPVTTSATFTENNTYTVPSGVDGYSAVTVNVDLVAPYNSGFTAGELAGYASGTTDGAAAQKALLSSTTITENGTYTSENGYSAVTVNVSSGGGGENRLNSLFLKTITAVTDSDLEHVEQIPHYAFSNNTNLVSCATIKVSPTGQIYVWDNAFAGCSNLTGITFDVSASVYQPQVNISQRAFSGCTKLCSITSEYITSVSTESFADCYSLSGDIKLKISSVVGTRAFKNCTGITSFTFIVNIAQVYGNNFFQGCSNVQYLDFTNNTSVPSLSDVNMFSAFTANYQIRVPQSLYDSWTGTTNWSTIASHIVAV